LQQDLQLQLLLGCRQLVTAADAIASFSTQPGVIANELQNKTKMLISHEHKKQGHKKTRKTDTAAPAPDRTGDIYCSKLTKLMR